MPWVSSKSGIHAPPAARNGKPMTDDELRAAELAILDGVPPPISPHTKRLLLDQDPTLAPALAKLKCWGQCTEAQPCGDCLTERRYLTLLDHRRKHGKPVHPSDRVGYGEPQDGELIPLPGLSVVPLTQASGRTDAANARRLVVRFGDVIRWVGPWDKWLIWDGRRWKIDQALRIEALAKEIAAALWKEIGATVSKGNIDKDTVAAMVSFARSSNSATGIRNMVALARSEPDMPIPQDRLDADPWLLNVENGTIDLRSGKLREHRREDFITKLAPVKSDPAADCPVWRAFLKKVFKGNDELTGYLRRLVGYTLTGVVEEHVLPFCHGEGANGKSTRWKRF